MGDLHIARRRKSEEPGPEFTLRIEDEEGSFVDHVFQCRPKISEVVLLELLGRMGGSSAVVSGGALVQMFDACMEPKEYRRFRVLVDDPEVEIEAEVLGDILRPLIAGYAERPTRRPSTSPDGPPATSDGSEENSGSEG